MFHTTYYTILFEICQEGNVKKWLCSQYGLVNPSAKLPDGILIFALQKSECRKKV